MKWDAIAIKSQTTGSILNGLLKKLKNGLISIKLIKLFSSKLKGIRSSIQTFMSEIQQSSTYSRSNDFSVNTLIRLLDGNDSAIKIRWYATKKHVSEVANEFRNEAFTHLNKKEFDKRTLVVSKIVEKQALIQHLQTELIILQTKLEHNFEHIENCQTFKRFSLDWKDAKFKKKFEKLISQLSNEIVKYSKQIDLSDTKTIESVSFDDMITDMIITMNGGMIDKDSITAKDFYIMLKKHKENGRVQH